MRFCKELRDRREAKEYWENKNDGSNTSNQSKYPNPLLTAVNVEVQRFNSRMILERQPHQINLIEPAFNKCRVEVERKKLEAKRSLQLPSHKELLTEINPSRKDMFTSLKIGQFSLAIPGVPKQPCLNKWPPDPPKLRSSAHPVHPDVSVVEEHPLASINLINSQTVSPSTTAQPRVVNKKDMSVAKVVPTYAMHCDNAKDPTAMQWDPPNG